MVSHMLRMQKVLGSSPSVSNFEKTNICFPSFPFPTLPHSGVFRHVCPMARSRRVAAPTEKTLVKASEFAMLALSVGRRQRSKFEFLRPLLECFPFTPPPAAWKLSPAFPSARPILARCPKWKQRRGILFVGGCEMHPPWGSNPRPQG